MDDYERERDNETEALLRFFSQEYASLTEEQLDALLSFHEDSTKLPDADVQSINQIIIFFKDKIQRIMSAVLDTYEKNIGHYDEDDLEKLHKMTSEKIQLDKLRIENSIEKKFCCDQREIGYIIKLQKLIKLTNNYKMLDKTQIYVTLIYLFYMLKYIEQQDDYLQYIKQILFTTYFQDNKAKIQCAKKLVFDIVSNGVMLGPIDVSRLINSRIMFDRFPEPYSLDHNPIETLLEYGFSGDLEEMIVDQSDG